MVNIKKSSRQPLVTIVTATYNSSKTLRMTLESALNQKFADFEHWVVGDACTDDSEATVKSFSDPRLRWINLPANSGSQGIPNNEGIRRAKGKYIAYLGHDDLWFPWHLSILLDFIEASRSDLVHPLSAVITPDGLERIVGPPGRGKTYQSHCGYPSSWLHRREIVDEVGYWADHRTLNCSVDHYFIKHIERAGKKISCLSRISLLKFPSPLWGNYKKGFNPGQSRYFEKMQKDPAGLEKEILDLAACRLALEWNPRQKFLPTLKQLLKIPVKQFIEFYGRDRWPVSRLVNWWFWRARKKSQIKRGLPRRQK